MKISIITVVYNSEKTIEEAIQSVLSQTYNNIEYIIIDGNSTDNTVSIINKYKSRLAYFSSEPDNGLYDAMNKGIAKCTGEIIAILNSDDLYESNEVISTVMSYFNSDLSLDILYGDLVYVKTNDVLKIVRRWKTEDYYDKFFDDGHVPPHPSLFLKRKIYKEAGVFNTRFNLAADYDFMLRVFKKFNFKSIYIQQIMIRMRLGGQTNKNITNIIKGNLQIIISWKENGLAFPWALMPKRVYRRLKQFL